MCLTRECEKREKEKQEKEIEAGRKRTERERQAQLKQESDAILARHKDDAIQYEQAVVNNQVAAASGLPVARTPKQEARFKKTGQDYALPDQVLRNRLKGNLYDTYFAETGSDEASKLAAKQVDEKGSLDLARRQNNIASQGLNAQGRLLNIAASLDQEVNNQGLHQNVLLQRINSLEKQVNSRRRNGLNRGR